MVVPLRVPENECGLSGWEPKSPEEKPACTMPALQGGRRVHREPISSRSSAQQTPALFSHRARRSLYAALLCGLLGIMSSRPALAWHHGKTEFVPYMGGLFLGERPHLQDAPIVGGRLVGATGRRSAIEVSAAMSPTNSISDPGFVVNVFLLQLDICYNIGPVPDISHVTAFPFLVLGIGAIDYDPGGPVDAAEDAAYFAVNFGIGGEYHFDEVLSVRLDVRDFVAALAVERFPIDLESELEPPPAKYTHNLEISAGIGISF